MPDRAARVIEVKQRELNSDGGAIEVETHRIVGFASVWNCDAQTQHCEYEIPPLPLESGDKAAFDRKANVILGG